MEGQQMSDMKERMYRGRTWGSDWEDRKEEVM